VFRPPKFAYKSQTFHLAVCRSRICGVSFTSIEQIGTWLRSSPEGSNQLSAMAICELLVAEPPKRGRAFHRSASARRLARLTQAQIQEITKSAHQS